MNFPNIRREAAAQISITESPREEWEPFTWVNLLGPAFAKKKKRRKRLTAVITVTGKLISGHFVPVIRLINVSILGPHLAEFSSANCLLSQLLKRPDFGVASFTIAGEPLEVRAPSFDFQFQVPWFLLCTPDPDNGRRTTDER